MSSRIDQYKPLFSDMSNIALLAEFITLRKESTETYIMPKADAYTNHVRQQTLDSISLQMAAIQECLADNLRQDGYLWPEPIAHTMIDDAIAHAQACAMAKYAEQQEEESTEPTPTYYVGMAGIHGCMPNVSEAYETYEEAVESMASLHELGRDRKRQLKRSGYLELL